MDAEPQDPAAWCGVDPASPMVGVNRGLIWAFDAADGGSVAIDSDIPPPGAGPAIAGFRWVHVGLADQWTRSWFAAAAVPAEVRELLLSSDRHQRAIVVDGIVAGVVHDFERDFDPGATARMGAMTFMLLPGMIVTARHHPQCAGDIISHKVRVRAPGSAAAALDLLLSSVAQVAHGVIVELHATVQDAEDAVLEPAREPDARALLIVRKRSIQIYRQLSGLRAVLARIESDEDLPSDLKTTVEKIAQRIVSLEGDIVTIQSNVRLLREELEIQTATRTNDNLYLLSVLSALLLPPTLVTGIFGMNTGGLPWTTSPNGTVFGLLLVFGSSAAVYFWLRARGFFRR